MVAWEAYLSVGNAMIDSDHKNLILLINEIEHAIGRRDCAELSRAMEAFVAHIHIHLRNEEQMAKAIKFPLAYNGLECEQLMYEIGCLMENLDSIEDAWPDNLVKKYSQFLNDWMMDHIIQENMQMKLVLQNFPYDLKPG